MHYRNSPIREALVDIKVELRSDFKFEGLKSIRSNVESKYPEEKTATRGDASLEIGPTVKTSSQQQPWGLFYTSADQKQVFQARLDGFTFSRLEPYETWERLRESAKGAWSVYRKVVNPTRIVRVASRYINQLNFQSARIEPEDYLKTFPQLSTDLSSELRDIGYYWMRLPILQKDLKGTLLINEALAPPKHPNGLSVILDFDLFVENPELDDESELWNLLDRVHARMNLYFEACITDKTRELIR